MRHVFSGKLTAIESCQKRRLGLKRGTEYLLMLGEGASPGVLAGFVFPPPDWGTRRMTMRTNQCGRMAVTAVVTHQSFHSVM